MPKLFIAPGACSFAAHVILKTLENGHGLHSEIVKVPLRQADSPILAVNPLGRVPTLQLDGGEILTENGAILPYLGDLVPEAGLFAPVGSLERSRIQEWIGFLNSDIHHAQRPIYRPEYFDADPATHEVIRAQGRQRLYTLLAYVDKRLPAAGWLFGERFTIADAYLGYFLRGVPRTGLALESLPAITAYAARYDSHPAVQAALAAEAA